METRQEFVRRSLAMVGGLALGGVSFGPGVAGAARASRKIATDKLTVVTGFGSGSIFGYAIQLTAQYAAKLGVTMNVTSVSTSLIGPTLLSGHADLIMGFSPLTALQLSDGGTPAIVVADMIPISDYVIAGNGNVITKPADLIGKKLATSGPGTQSDLVARLIIAQEGLNWNGITIVPIASSTSRLPALLAGTVDAATLYHDQAFTAQAENPAIKIILDTAKVVPTMFASAEGLRDTMNAKRPTVVKLLMAYAQVAAFAKLNPSKFVDGFMAAYPQAIRHAALKTTTFYGQKGYWDPDLMTHADILVRNATEGATAENPPIVPKIQPLSNWVDITFRDQAIKNLGGVGWWKPKTTPKKKK